MATVAPVVRLVSIAYWSTAASIIRRSFKIRLACERLRARRNPGTAIAASNAMMATTIMISTRVKPLRCLLQVFNIVCYLVVCDGGASRENPQEHNFRAAFIPGVIFGFQRFKDHT